MQSVFAGVTACQGPSRDTLTTGLPASCPVLARVLHGIHSLLDPVACPVLDSELVCMTSLLAAAAAACTCTLIKSKIVVSKGFNVFATWLSGLIMIINIK